MFDTYYDFLNATHRDGTKVWIFKCSCLSHNETAIRIEIGGKAEASCTRCGVAKRCLCGANGILYECTLSGNPVSLEVSLSGDVVQLLLNI